MNGTLAFLVLFAVIAVVMVIIGLRSRTAPKKLPPANDGSLTIRATRVIAIVWTGAATLGTLYAIITTLASPAVSVHMPVAGFWPSPYPTADVDYPAATVVGGVGFTFADVTVEGIGIDVRVLLSLGHLSIGATNVIEALAVYSLSSRLLNREPFRSVLSIHATRAAIAVILGGIFWQVFFGVAGSLASGQVLATRGWGIDTDKVAKALDPLSMPVIGWPQYATNISIDFWPIAAGLALLAIAAAFRHSERLQRDTEGLV